jgi:hypothetical protein
MFAVRVLPFPFAAEREKEVKTHALTGILS